MLDYLTESANLCCCTDASVTGRQGRGSDVPPSTSPSEETGISVKVRMTKDSFESEGVCSDSTESGKGFLAKSRGVYATLKGKISW